MRSLQRDQKSFTCNARVSFKARAPQTKLSSSRLCVSRSQFGSFSNKWFRRSQRSSDKKPSSRQVLLNSKRARQQIAQPALNLFIRQTQTKLRAFARLLKLCLARIRIGFRIGIRIRIRIEFLAKTATGKLFLSGCKLACELQGKTSAQLFAYESANDRRIEFFFLFEFIFRCSHELIQQTSKLKLKSSKVWSRIDQKLSLQSLKSVSVLSLSFFVSLLFLVAQTSQLLQHFLNFSSTEQFAFWALNFVC